MAEGAVFDLGYAKHEGIRLGRRGAFRALYKDGLRRVLGLRRRARRKIFPAVLLAIAILPAGFFVAIGVLEGQLDASAELFSHANYFDLTAVISLIFIALASSELLVPDRENGTMAVYGSRPLTVVDYLLGRAAALATVVFGFVWLPQVILWVGRAWVDRDGFGSAAVDSVDVLWETALVAIIYLVAYASPAFLIAAFVKRTSMAAGVLLGVVSASGPASSALVEAGFDVFALGAINQHPGFVKDWIMGTNTREWIIESAGYEAAVSLTVILLIAAATAFIVVRRYRRSA